jgi:polyphosphate kinase
MAKDKQKKHEAAGSTGASGKMKRKEFEKELAKLQVELTRLQTWVKDTGARVIVIFEGRDTAGKGGVISRITARHEPAHLPAGGIAERVNDFETAQC